MAEAKNRFQRVMRSTSTVVWLAALLVAVAMVMQGLALSWDSAGQLSGIMLPHVALTWAFAAIASGYAGTDRILQFVKTNTLEYGTVDLGDPKKLRKLIFITVALLIEGIVLSTFFGVPGLALEALATAFGGTGSAYVIGNKAVQAASCSEGKHTMREQPQFIAEDIYDGQASGK